MCIIWYVCTYVGTANVNDEAESVCATDSICQLDHCSLHMHCVIDDAASDDRADRCSFTFQHHYNDRRRFSNHQTNTPCEYRDAWLNLYAYYWIGTYVCIYRAM